MDRHDQTNKCVTIGRCKSRRLRFANEIVLLAFPKSGLQHVLKDYAAVGDIAGIKISTFKTEVLHLSRNPVQCTL